MSTDLTSSAENLGPGRADSPSCHDGVTMTCPVCQQPFTPVGRQKYCGDACRAAAYRRRRDASTVTVIIPKAQPRRPVTVYECDGCGARALGDPRCGDCGTLMRRVGFGGLCPCCDEAVAVDPEMLGQEVIA